MRAETHLTTYGYYELAAKPTEKELETYYAQKYYQAEKATYRHTYDERELAYVDAMIGRKRSIAERMLGAANGKRKLLDVGCGEGWALKHFAEQGWEIQGVDFGKAGLVAHNPQLEPFVATGNVPTLLKEWPKPSSGYDIIWLDNVLEHALEPLELLVACKRLLQPNGVLVIEVPNDFSPVQLDLVQKGLLVDSRWVAVPDHISYFNRNGLQNLLNAAGWTLERALADFPIDWLLYHPASHYYNLPEQGSAAHAARQQIELLIEAQGKSDATERLYAALAELGLGRQIIAFCHLA
jgi:2-polyprenyl-3-methyl-5-hydroxy-6-metoxy-1,4-benzoquinol methylase